MSLDWIRNIVFFVVLLLAQVLVFNHVHLFGCATPLLYVYYVLPVRRNQPRWVTLLLCFAMGLCTDSFSNTPGVATASMTLVGLLQPYLLMLFVQQDSPDDLRPSMKVLGTMKYVSFTIAIVLTYCLVFFSLEAFNYNNWVLWLASVGGSALLTTLLILVIDNFRGK